MHNPLIRPHLLRSAALGALAGVTALVSGGMPASGAPGTAWSATVVVQNLADTPNEAAVSYYSTTGVLMKTYPLGGIPPKGTAYLDASQVGELPANFAGGAVVSSAQPVSLPT